MRTIATSMLDSLNMKDYFPAREKAERVLDIHDEEGDIATRIQQNVLRVENAPSGEVCVIKETLTFSPNGDSFSLSKETRYVVSETGVTQIYQFSSLFGENDKVIIELKRSPSWKADSHSVSWMTGINQTIRVAAGEFKGCLEITEKAGETVTKKYYAPNHIGLVLSLIKTSEGRFIVFSELVHYVDGQAH